MSGERGYEGSSQMMTLMVSVLVLVMMTMMSVMVMLMTMSMLMMTIMMMTSGWENAYIRRESSTEHGTPRTH